MKTCCCTGHRPKGFPFGYGKDRQKHADYLQTLYEMTERAITVHGATHFITGMALGVDLDFAETVIKLKDKYDITLECAVPCPDQTAKWYEKDRRRYEKILALADEVKIISERYTPACMLIRNRYMIDNSELVIAVFNGIEKGGTWYSINYAKKTGKKLEIIDLCT